MPEQKRKFGNWGERLAKNFLQKRNYEIIEINYQKKCGEIDIIACKEGCLHFIEVKTRTDCSVKKFGLPEDAVNKTKQKKIIQTAYTYLSENNNSGNINWQIDVISIVYSDERKKAKIRLIDNAFDEC